MDSYSAGAVPLGLADSPYPEFRALASSGILRANVSSSVVCAAFMRFGGSVYAVLVLICLCGPSG